MSLKERVQAYCSLKKISVARFERWAGLSNGYFSQVRGTPSLDKIEKIQNAFPDLRKEWLLFGEGDMLKSDTELKMSAYPVAENGGALGDDSIVRDMLRIIREQATTMRMMQERIAQLEQKLTENGIFMPDIAASAIREGKNPPPTILPQNM